MNDRKVDISDYFYNQKTFFGILEASLGYALDVAFDDVDKYKEFTETIKEGDTFVLMGYVLGIKYIIVDYYVTDVKTSKLLSRNNADEILKIERENKGDTFAIVGYAIGCDMYRLSNLDIRDENMIYAIYYDSKFDFIQVKNGKLMTGIYNGREKVKQIEQN